MIVRDALREGAAALSGTETPFLDASLLLAAAMGVESARLYASGPDPVSEDSLESYRAKLSLRARGLPVAYILGYKEFWSRRFVVDPRVLIPRPDTETLVEATLKLGDIIQKEKATTEARREEESTEEELREMQIKGSDRNVEEVSEEQQNTQANFSSLFSLRDLHQTPCLRGSSLSSFSPLRVHEACTGSGCVAVSLAAERPEWEVSASDLSESALEVARINVDALLPPTRSGGPVRLARSDLLSSVMPQSEEGGNVSQGVIDASTRPFDLILANPPYVGSSETDRLLSQGWSEPRMALDGGEDGLDLVRQLTIEAAEALAPGGALLVEADGDQSEAVAELFRASRFIHVETLCDLGGRPRVTSGRKPWMT
jgi:release factor glutamine methyltransferase